PGVAVTLAGSATVADSDNAILASATVQVTGGFAADGDVLSATVAAISITASYSPATERMTLTGADSLAHYQAVLDRLTFSSGANPTNSGANLTRTVTWTLNDGSPDNNLSTPVTETINITPNSAPILGNVSASPRSPELPGVAVTLAGSATVADSDNAN